jgi:Helix-turn-helix domain
MTQTARILALLQCGPVTPLQALEQVGCFRLAARISDLKAEGHVIVTDRVTSPSTGKSFARYRLVTQAQTELWR